LKKTAEADASEVTEGRRGSQFIGVRGDEKQSSLMFCARQSVVAGVRLLLFHRMIDGQYKVQAKGKKERGEQRERKAKVAVSRIMIASAKMRYFKFRGGGEIRSGEDHVHEADDLDEITICNAHLHARTAKRDLLQAAAAYKNFWDVLARYLVEFGPRYLCGDFNMALFSVVPELRARGFLINLAAWYCWQNQHEEHVRADSCAIFRIGPCHGIRMCFDASAFGLTSPELPPNCSMVMESVRNVDGKEIEKRRYGVPKIGFLGQGYPLKSYKPDHPPRKEEFVRWTFTPVFAKESPAVAEIKAVARKSDVFPSGVNTTIGSASWSWPVDMPSKQKLTNFNLFDPSEEFVKRGAHAPVMIFLGGHSETRRTKKAQERRAMKADKRGFTWEYRQPTQKGKSKGKGKGGKEAKKGEGKSSGSK
jgi:hypothetical protein